MSKLTRKINGGWDYTSLKGERKTGIVCDNCGKIVPLAYLQEGDGYATYAYCPSCFTGNIEGALICKVG